MKKTEHRAILTSGRGVLHNPSTAGRSYGNAGNADDILKLKVTGTTDAISLSPLRDLVGFNERTRLMYSERGGTLVSKRKRSMLNASSRSKSTKLQSEEAAASVPALFVVPIPPPAVELIPLFAAYRHQLGEAGGQCLIWRLIGNPKQQDSIFKVQIDDEMRSVRAKKIAEFLKGVDEEATESDFVGGEYYKLARNLGIPTADLPAILFVAPHPVDALAVLYLDVAMFRDVSRQQAVVLHLLKSITQDRIVGLAPGGQFTRQTMFNVQEYLDTVALELRNMTIDASQPIAVAGDEAQGTAFAIFCGSDRKRTDLNDDQYRRLKFQWNRYDVIIDGIAGKCFKPHERNVKYREEVLEPAELRILTDYIVRRRPLAPSRAGGKHSSTDTALRTLQKARAKLESIDGKKGALWFHQIRNGWGGPSRFQFSPPSGKRWLLIELKPEEEKEE